MEVGCPIRRSLGQRLLTPHQRLSQRATSFIACACQGIHQLPLPHARESTPPTAALTSSADECCGSYISTCKFDRDNRPTEASRHRDRGIDLKTHSQCQIVGPRWSYPPKRDTCSLHTWKNGGACRDRTDDLKLAKLALSQLS